jgi:hypothetical protein
MMETTGDTSPVGVFYSRPFDLSYSSLNKMLYSPSLFYTHYILRQREDLTDTHVMAGKVVHALLLDDGSFDQNFIVSQAKLPGDNSRKLVDQVYYLMTQLPEGDSRTELKEFEVEILDTMRLMVYYQALKTDQQRIEKILTAENINYFSFLKLRRGKSLIDEATLVICRESVEAIRRDNRASELLKLKHCSTNFLKIYNEYALRAELPGFPFGLKGILDNFVVDYSKRTIHINDLKVTGKSLSDFKDSLEYYMYWAQAAIYMRLIESWVNARETAHEESFEGWEVFFHFIVIDKFMQIYPFPVRLETLARWQGRLDEKLEIARYHYESRDYSLPYEFAKGQVEL